MKKQLSAAIGFIVLIGITSCKKEKDFVPQNNCRVTTLTNPSGQITSVLLYDNQDRLIQLQEKVGENITGYQSYEYFPDKFIHIYSDINYKAYRTQEYYLNSDGTVKYFTQIWLYNNQCDTTFFYYNDKGYDTLEVCKTYIPSLNESYSDSTFFIYKDDNLSYKKYVYNKGMFVDATHYVYTPIVNKQDIFTGECKIPGLYGKGNKYLPASSTTYGPGEISSEKYTYELDASGYVIRRTIVVSHSSLPASAYDTTDIGLRYMCK